MRVEDGLRRAERLCAEQALRLTPVRRKVLEILLQNTRALGAYAILDVLSDAGFGSQPPVVYRALEFLIDRGFVHKIGRLNAFVACDHPGETHAPAFLICRLCNAVAETHGHASTAGLGSAAKTSGFRIERTVVEAEGVCSLCLESAGA